MPARIRLRKVSRLGVGTVPSVSVSIMKSVIQPTRALLSDVRSALYCARLQVLARVGRGFHSVKADAPAAYIGWTVLLLKKGMTQC